MVKKFLQKKVCYILITLILLASCSYAIEDSSAEKQDTKEKKLNFNIFKLEKKNKEEKKQPKSKRTEVGEIKLPNVRSMRQPAKNFSIMTM